MAVTLERSSRPARPGVRRRFSIMTTVENHALILDGDCRPVPTMRRASRPLRPRTGRAVRKPPA